jgi:hypothetical protein
MPMVLLTLLSIVQALALELLWSHIGERSDLYVWSFDAFLGWLQVLASLAGLIQIWLVYSTTVMRFAWVPSIGDSVWPFFIGILEFVLINNMGLSSLSRWLFVMALIFGLMTAGTHSVMRRARLNSGNAEFFATVDRATTKDFIPQVLAVLGLSLFAAYFWRNDDSGWVALLALMYALGLLAYQIFLTGKFWNQSISEQDQ